MFQRAARQVRQRLEELLCLQGCLDNPDDLEGHHNLRIAAKRLRYTLEICNVAFEKQLKEYVKTIKRIQTLLGDIHDCDVWCAFLEEFGKQEESRILQFYGYARPFEQILPGLEYLTETRRQQRDTLFRQLQDEWERITAASTWGRLLADLEGRPGASRKPLEPQSDTGIEREVGFGITCLEDRADQ